MRGGSSVVLAHRAHGHCSAWARYVVLKLRCCLARPRVSPYRSARFAAKLGRQVKVETRYC
jgi:hypothetical protein